MTMEHYPADQIFAPSDLIEDLADRGVTPFYLYDEQGIRDRTRELHSAFSKLPQYQNYYPIRDNNNPTILKILKEAGTGVCACNRIELELAIHCGFTGTQLAYEPSTKDSFAEALAFSHDVVWICNSEFLIPDPLPKNLILRYNPIELRLPLPIKKTVLKNKLGLSRSQILKTAARLAALGKKRIGLSVHISGYSTQEGFWLRKAEMLFSIAKELSSHFGIQIWCYHLGEALGLSYHPSIPSSDLSSEIQPLQELYEQQPDHIRVPILTGISSRLMDPCGILITKILECRKISRTFIIVDACMSHYSRFSLKQAYRHVSVLGRSEIQDRRLYTVAGELPDTMDRLVHKGRMLPQVQVGDYCVIHDVGSGARSMPMLYGCRSIAAEYLYTTDGEIRQIAPARTEEEVFRFLTAL